MPWWLPENWMMVGLGIISGHALAEIWALHCRYRFANKPRRYVKALMTMLVTSCLLSALGWLDGQSLRAAIYIGVLWGCPSPLLWIAFQEAVHWKSPALAARLGYERRGPREDPTQWTPERRELHRRGLFEDTGKMDAVERKDG